MITHFLLIIFLFFMSCTSNSPMNLIEAPKNSDIYFVSNRVQDSCFDNKNPQFLTNFSALNSHSNFQLEGAWKNNYNVLNMQVLGPFGESYAYFELNEHKIRVFSSRKDILENQEIKNLVSFVSSLGAKELRSLFCGSYAFEKDKRTKSIYLNHDSSAQKEIFFTQSGITIDGHSLEVNSNLDLEGGNVNEGYNLVIKSKFSYGFFGADSNFTVHWLGYVDAAKVYPKYIYFGYEKSSYELSILDYN